MEKNKKIKIIYNKYDDLNTLYSELKKNHNIDSVYIVLPDKYLVDHCKAAIISGIKKIMVEKPVGNPA